MDGQSCDSQMSLDKMAREELVREKTDETGVTWRKVYFGGGIHFDNWLAQAKKLEKAGKVWVRFRLRR